MIEHARWFAVLACLSTSPAWAGDLFISHPGGDLDRWIHAAPAAQVAPRAGAFYQPEKYPTHAVTWHIVGSRESRPELIEHLTTHPEHADVRRMYSAADLRRMTRAQLQTLHDDSHERRLGRASAHLIPAPIRSSCPGGVCPPNRSRRLGIGFINTFVQ